MISDTIPALFDYISSTPSGVEVGDVISWDIGNLGVGENGTLQVVVYLTGAAEGIEVENAVYGTYASALDHLPRSPVTAKHQLLVLPDEQFYISRNIFNPLQGEVVNIRWKIGADKRMFLGIYNTAGEMVRLLERGAVVLPFSYGEVSWDGKNEKGDYVASGVYIVYLHGRKAYYGKIVVVK